MHERKLAVSLAMSLLAAALVFGTSLVLAQNYNGNTSYTNTTNTSKSTTNTSYPTYSSSPVPVQSPTQPTVTSGNFLRGDANRDARVDISDIIYIGMAVDQPNPPPGRRGETRLVSPCWDAADANDDGRVDINDALAIIATKFGGSGPLPAPYPLAGSDPTTDTLGCDSYQAPSWALFLRGDANNDLRVDISDPTYIQNYLSRGGPAPKCPDAADANDDGQITGADAERILNFKFSGGAPPAAPYPDLGGDPTTDALGCPTYP